MLNRTRNVLGAVALVLGLALAPISAQADQYWQCVPFARLVSGIQIFGDAHTWWRQASGKYETGKSPKAGSVLVFKPQGKMSRGHVAVVSRIFTDRIVQVTHANWSQIDGRRGQIEENVTMVDVSDANDWSQVKVWYNPIGDLGTTQYPTYGFIYQDSQAQALASAAQATQGITATVAAAALPSTDPLAGILQQAMRLVGN